MFTSGSLLRLFACRGSKQVRAWASWAAVVLLLSTSGCSLFMAFNYDPEGLPCDPEGGCLSGYTCVDEVCRYAAAKQVGDDCSTDEECESGVCADAYDQDCGDDINCELGAGRESSGLKCRAQCNPSEPASDSCATSEFCFVDGDGAVAGYCQEGTCGVDGNCGENRIPLQNGFDIQQNVCMGISNNGDLPGLCVLGCNPLLCDANAGCAGCPLQEASCEAVDINTNDRFACFSTGFVPHNGACDVNNPCAPGSFCLPSGGAAYCARYCLVGGGAPACVAPQTCNVLNGNVGFCQ